MHVLIDRSKLRFLRKHPDAMALCNLAWIELPSVAVRIEQCDSPSFLSDFTDYELKLLYESTTGEKQAYYGDSLRAVLLELVHRMPVCDINVSEVSDVAGAVPDDCDEPYKYVKGSRALVHDHTSLFPHLQAKRSEHEAVIVGKRKSIHAELYPDAIQEFDFTVPVSRAGYNEHKRTGTEPRAPRQGGIREVIWAQMDKMWEAAGKTTDIKEVLALRKSCMAVLESEQGVKRNSSSNELGAWQKIRIQP